MKPNHTPVLTRPVGGLRRPGPLQRTTRIGLSLLLVLSHPLWAATIIVDETTCTLVDAVDAANTDSTVGGCTAGSGADTIELTTNVTLSEANNCVQHNPNYPSCNGLPVLDSDITVAGGGFTIQRSDGFFRFFEILESATLTLTDVTLFNGVSDTGGAILNFGSLSLTDTTVSSNVAMYDGGGISGGGPNSSLTLVNSTVLGNSVGSKYMDSMPAPAIRFFGPVTLVNSTVSGNTAYSNPYTYDLIPSAIHIDNAGSVTLTNSTLTNNTGALLVRGGCFASVANTVVAGNGAMHNCWGSGSFLDQGNNFSDDDSCGSGFADITPDVDFDTRLADNGGPTQTHALFPGSVAIDAAGDCGLETDQRGYPRNDGACDSGSFEFQEPSDVPATTYRGMAVTALLLLVASTAFLLRRRATH
jgi:hypothetical protein